MLAYAPFEVVKKETPAPVIIPSMEPVKTLTLKDCNYIVLAFILGTILLAISDM